MNCVCDTSHYPKEGPWELPEGWTWSTIGEYVLVVTDFVASGSFASLRENVTYYKEPNYAILVRTVDFQNNFSSGLVYTDEHGYDFLENSRLFGGELILPNIGASIGKVFLVPHISAKMTLAPNSIMIRCMDSAHQPWIEYCLKSPYGQKLLFGISSATAQGKFNKTDFKGLIIPIPPLAEQEQICSAIYRLFSQLDSLDDSYYNLERLLSASKARILDLAVHGKLVSQDPMDEPAINLLRRINPAFQPAHNLHYAGDLPKGWCLTHLNEVAVYGDTSNIDVSSINPDSWILELEDLEKDTARILAMKTKADCEVSGVRHSFRKGQILYSKLRTYLNKVLIAPDDGFCTTEIVPITTRKAILPDYLLMVMRSPFFLEYTASCGYGVKMPRLGTSDAKKAIIPLPPLTEQARIVEKISELMTVISSL